MQEQRTPRRTGAWGALVALGLALGPAIPLASASRPGASAQLYASPSDGLVRLIWERRDYVLGDWPEELEPEQVEVLEAWRPFAEAHGYRMDLAQGGHVLVLSNAVRNRSVHTWNERVKETLELCDELITWTAPGTPPLGLDLGYTLGQRDPGDGLQVLVRLASSADRDALVQDLVRRAPELGDWAASALDQEAFLLRDPGCAAWIEAGREAVGYAPGECVNRLTHLMLEQRFGVLPAFLEEGLAWYVEQEVTGRISSAPVFEQAPSRLPRQGFGKKLKSLFDEREDQPVGPAELLAGERGSWNGEQAALAWGTCHFMAEVRPGSIAEMCADLALGRDSLELVGRGDGTWNGLLREDWDEHELALAITRHQGPTARSKWSQFFASGRIWPGAR